MHDWMWQWVGVWRSAARFNARHRDGYAGKAVQALMLGIFGGVTCLAGYVVWRGDTHLPSYTVVLENDHTLGFEGGMRRGATRALEEQLDAHPTVTVIRLASPGGLGVEGIRMRNLIRRRGLTTYVDDVCASACTTAYLGGARRYLDEEAELAFHRGRISWLPGSPETSGIEAVLMREQGISQSFIDHVDSTPASTIWSPTVAELLQAGVVHEVGEPDAPGNREGADTHED